MRIIRDDDADPVGLLRIVERCLMQGAEDVREKVDCDVGVRKQAHEIWAEDASAREQFASADQIVSQLRYVRWAYRDVPNVAPKMQPTPAAPPMQARAAMPPARPSATTSAVRAAPDAPPALRRPIAEGQTLGPRMSLAELLSRAGLPPFDFLALGSVRAAATLRDYARQFQAMGLDPTPESGGLTVDRARARAVLDEFAPNVDELHHLLAR